MHSLKSKHGSPCCWDQKMRTQCVFLSRSANNYFPCGFNFFLLFQLCEKTTPTLSVLWSRSSLCSIFLTLMSDSRFVCGVSLCCTERNNNCTLYVFCCRGAGGTTGTTGRATMSNTAEWMTWCCSARSMRTPLWTTSRRDTWMTTSLYPFLTITVHILVWNSWVLSQLCSSQKSWMFIHSDTVAVSKRSGSVHTYTHTSNSCCLTSLKSHLL